MPEARVAIRSAEQDARLIVTQTGAATLGGRAIARWPAAGSASLVAAAYSAFFALFFSAVWWQDGLLAPGDAMVTSLAAFYTRWRVWSPDVASGAPILADPSWQRGYPLLWLFSAVGAWNGFVIAAYVMAAGFTFGFVFTLTHSRTAAAVSGLTYSLSAFMMAHLGHVNIVHCAAWMPLVVWAFERLRRKWSSGWQCVATLAVALCALSGHPQILTYGVGLAVAYAGALGGRAAIGRWRFYTAVLCAVLGGVGLAAFHLIPAFERMGLSTRGHLSFEKFSEFALPPGELLQLVFPFLFGYGVPGPYSTGYFGVWGLTETSGYCGLLPIALALIAVASQPRDAVTRFWVVAAVLTVMLALGTATPLGAATYWLPGYGLFRCLGRHLVETALAIATLAGLGVAALQREPDRAPLRSARAGLTLLGLVGSGAVVVWMHSARLRAFAASRGVASVPASPWDNPAVVIPIAVAVLAALVLVTYGRRPALPSRIVLLLACLVIDLGTVVWFFDWRRHFASSSILEIPAHLRPYRERVHREHSRIANYEGLTGALDAAVPNVNALWEIPSASGYSSVGLQRYEQALRWEDPRLLESGSRVLDVLGVRYLFRTRRWKADFEWGTNAAVVFDETRQTRTWPVDGFEATQLGLVAALAYAVNVPEGTPVAVVRIDTVDDRTLSFPLRAGAEISEWAHDHPDVLPRVEHSRARIFNTTLARTESGEWFRAYSYLAVLDLQGMYRVRRVTVERLTAGAALMMYHVSLRNERTGTTSPIHDGLADADRWRHLEDTGRASAYENLRALPRAWLVRDVRRVEPDEALAALQSSVLPDGRPFDPRALALVEESLPVRLSGANLEGEVRIVASEEARTTLDVEATREAFLVLSDVHYPGWRVSIDGRETRLYQTNYLLRGVVVPPGRHRVEFVFLPSSFYLGAVISSLCAAALIIMIALPGGRW